MMRSMFSGVSGLKVHQTKMDVIGNNIANVNTVGYKAQRVTFSDVFSQTISSASAASDDTGRGGVNAKQVGLGVTVASIDMRMTQGSSQRTDNPFDLMVTGDGFMVVGDNSGEYFTRAGALRTDDEGNLIIPNGMHVKGWLATKDKDGKYSINQGEVQNINLATDDISNSSPTPTSTVKITGNLKSSEKENFKYETNINYYDSLGNNITIPVTLLKGETTGDPSTTKWDVILSDRATDANKNSYIVNVDTVESATPTTATGGINLGTLEFDSDGKLVPPATGDYVLDLGGVSLNAIEADGVTAGDLINTAQDIALDLSNITQYASTSDLDPVTENGSSAGALKGYSIGSNGVITAYYTNGDMRDVAQVVVANFVNPEGLEKVGENLYSATTNSGDFDGIGQGAAFQTGVLEMSNVDLSEEFSEMIITQRGFQANSRIITVSDSMLEELTNLKR